MTDKKKKKKALRRELIIGGGAMVIILPLVLLAILGAGASIVVGVMMSWWMPEANLSPLTMLVVYGVLLTTLLVFGYKFCVRLIAVIRRMINIRGEQKRISEETRVYVIETTEPVDELADGSESEMAPRRLTRR